ncbi:hypothetical protein FACS189425_06000 [Clostridia bacterium]|nr:hypothetical protein FACS189425_06000 [Clostridia bacterium]
MGKKMSEILARKLEYPKTLTDENGVVFHFVCSAGLRYVEGTYLLYHRTEPVYPTRRLAEVSEDKSVRLLTQAESDNAETQNRNIAKVKNLEESIYDKEFNLV